MNIRQAITTLQDFTVQYEKIFPDEIKAIQKLFDEIATFQQMQTKIKYIIYPDDK